MKEMKSTIDYFPGMFKYYFGYAWMRFYMEEGIKKTWMKKDDEFIFLNCPIRLQALCCHLQLFILVWSNI